MKRLLKVTDKDGLYRDPDTGAILNLDNEAYTLYLKKRQSALEKARAEKGKENEINTLRNDVNSLTEKVDKILNALEKLTNGNS